MLHLQVLMLFKLILVLLLKTVYEGIGYRMWFSLSFFLQGLSSSMKVDKDDMNLQVARVAAISCRIILCLSSRFVLILNN